MAQSNADILEEPTDASAAQRLKHAPRRLGALSLAVLIAAVIYAIVFLWLFFSAPPKSEEQATPPSFSLALSPVHGTVNTQELLRGDQVTRDAQSEVLTVLRTSASAEVAPEFTPELTPKSAPTTRPKRGVESAFVLPIDPPEKKAEKSNLKKGAKETTQKISTYSGPHPDLLEKGKYGRLPIISKTGVKPWQAYATPIDPLPTNRPIVALIIGGMGISGNSTTYAISQLPAAVTLAFAPYGNGLQHWMDSARTQGHETLIELPMEPFDYPNNDPGPYTLLTHSDPAKNLDRLHWLLSRGSGYVGVSNYQGARFISNAKALAPIFAALHKRGLMYVDHPGVGRSRAKEIALAVDMPLSQGTIQIDPKLNKYAIDEALLRLEEQAKQHGVAVGFGSGFPLTIDRIDAWSKRLDERGVTLVPVSATVNARYKFQ